MPTFGKNIRTKSYEFTLHSLVLCNNMRFSLVLKNYGEYDAILYL